METPTQTRPKVIDFKEYRRRPEVRERCRRRWFDRQPPEHQGEIVALMEAVLDDPRSKAILVAAE